MAVVTPATERSVRNQRMIDAMYQMIIAPVAISMSAEMVKPVVGAGAVGSRRRSSNCSTKMNTPVAVKTVMTKRSADRRA